MRGAEYKVPSRKQPVFTPIKKFLRLFYKKPMIINLAGALKDKCIILMNHAAKSGPMSMELYFPKFNVKWGAHEMLDGFVSRRRYLRDVYYIQKKGYNRLIASLIATFEAVFSGMIYKGMKFIPSYRDVRLKSTIEYSIKALDTNAAVAIFPENSEKGYKELPTEFNPGFTALAESYFKKTGEDIPIYPVYYHLKKRKLVIGEAEYLQKLKGKIKSKKEMAEYFLHKVNGLCLEYV